MVRTNPRPWTWKVTLIIGGGPRDGGCANRVHLFLAEMVAGMRGFGLSEEEAKEGFVRVLPIVDGMGQDELCGLRLRVPTYTGRCARRADEDRWTRVQGCLTASLLRICLQQHCVPCHSPACPPSSSQGRYFFLGCHRRLSIRSDLSQMGPAGELFRSGLSYRTSV